jgi:hypothetical protein
LSKAFQYSKQKGNEDQYQPFLTQKPVVFQLNAKFSILWQLLQQNNKKVPLCGTENHVFNAFIR